MFLQLFKLTKIYVMLELVLNSNLIFSFKGRAIAEAVSRWLPTAAARVHARVWQVGFVADKMAPGQVFSEYFGFPCQPHFIPPTSPSSQSPGTGTIGQYMAAVPCGHPIWTPPPTIRFKKKIFLNVSVK
jgi:hypothetical protein